MKVPASRIKLATEETITDEVGKPEIRFHRSNATKSIIQITLGFDTIADITEDSEVSVGEEIKKNYRDALIDSADFFIPGNVKVTFVNNGTADGAKMLIEADIPTKVPGTGARIMAEPDEAKQHM